MFHQHSSVLRLRHTVPTPPSSFLEWRAELLEIDTTPCARSVHASSQALSSLRRSFSEYVTANRSETNQRRKAEAAPDCSALDASRERWNTNSQT